MNSHVSGAVSAGGAPATSSHDILGVTVAALAWDEAMGLLRRRLTERRFTKVAFLNAHVANIAATQPNLRDAVRDFLVLPDGVGVDLAAKMLYGRRFPANLNGTDFVPAFLAAQKERLRVGLLGATRDNAEKAAAALQRMLPQHEVLLIDDGFFDAAAETMVLERLVELRPDVLLVAMGVPRQEFWIDRRLSERHCTVAFGVGALLDFLGGAVPRAPGWVRTLRFEWLFRLWIEPARLWRRYIVGNPVFLLRVLRQKLRGPGAVR